MILQCPACETKFLVDATLIPPEGRMVKCARCAHQWHVEGDDLPLPKLPPSLDTLMQDAEEPAISFEEERQVALQPDHQEPFHEPVIKFENDYDIPLSPHEEAKPSRMPHLVLAVSLLLMIVGLAMIAFRESLPPFLSPIASLIGVESTEGLALADVQFRTREGRSKVNYVIEGKIVNESQEIRKVPVLRVALVDAQGTWLLSREYEAEDGAEIKPGESYAFKATRLETAFADRVDHLTVDIGNGIELMLRE
jgi:predicted Zn finger-like uncharacterized protein